ncbi:hypothetical protein [Kosakonia cowanii]|uniref:hypothetical protein n=1 Tax=Kosakonia cowanii TaxID=208223 RepID=UPI0039B7707A
MNRINQIVSILSKMESYTPFAAMKSKNKTLIKIQNYSLLGCIFCLVLLVVLIIMCLIFDIEKKNVEIYAIIILIITHISGIVCLLTPVISGIKFIYNMRKEVLNDFQIEVNHDEKNVEQLDHYSISELDYATYWLNFKIERFKARISDFFGTKTAILSILGLSYSAVQALGGFEKISSVLAKGLFNSDIANIISILGLSFLLGVSLGAIVMKNIINHFEYLKNILELAKQRKKNSLS